MLPKLKTKALNRKTKKGKSAHPYYETAPEFSASVTVPRKIQEQHVVFEISCGSWSFLCWKTLGVGRDYGAFLEGDRNEEEEICPLGKYSKGWSTCLVCSGFHMSSVSGTTLFPEPNEPLTTLGRHKNNQTKN